MAAAVAAMQAAYAELSTGQAHVPLRVAGTGQAFQLSRLE